jgi:hypothetical protein
MVRGLLLFYNLITMSLIKFSQANLPNLRRLFVEARTEAEESQYSRNAVSFITLYVYAILLMCCSSTILCFSCLLWQSSVSLHSV